MKEFDIKVSISKTECVNIKANSEEEAIDMAKKDAILKYGTENVSVLSSIEVSNIEPQEEVVQLPYRKEVANYIDKNLFWILNRHMCYFKYRYEGKEKNELENYLQEHIELKLEILQIELKLDIELTELEYDYFKQKLIKEVVKEIFKD